MATCSPRSARPPAGTWSCARRRLPTGSSSRSSSEREGRQIMSTILVLIDHETGALKKVSKQILTAARGLGDEVHAAMFGPGVSGHAESLGAFGASTVHVWDDEAVTAYATEPE